MFDHIADIGQDLLDTVGGVEFVEFPFQWFGFEVGADLGEDANDAENYDAANWEKNHCEQWRLSN